MELIDTNLCRKKMSVSRQNVVDNNGHGNNYEKQNCCEAKISQIKKCGKIKIYK